MKSGDVFEQAVNISDNEIAKKKALKVMARNLVVSLNSELYR